MAAFPLDAQSIDVTNAIVRQDLRLIYQHTTNANDTDTWDVGLPIVHASWEGDTDGDVAQVDITGTSEVTINTGGSNIDGGVLVWVRDYRTG